MRLATWNVNSVKARLPRLLDWLERTEPDIVCLQETKVADSGFPTAAVQERGYAVAHHGEGRWNGVAVLSRVGLDEVQRGLPGDPGWNPPTQEGLLPAAPAYEARAVGATCDGIRVWSVYVPNGRAVGDPHYAYKLAWLAALRDAVRAEMTRPLAVCGDFNIAPTDDDVWDPAAFTGSTHVTERERAALQRLLDLGFTDLPARALKGPHPYTYWDYRAGAFHKAMGMRIDLVLASASLAGAVRDAYVDREARKGAGASDHAPVVVDLEL